MCLGRGLGHLSLLSLLPFTLTLTLALPCAPTTGPKVVAPTAHELLPDIVGPVEPFLSIS